MRAFDDNVLRAMLDPGPLPQQAQQKLNDAYALLGDTPQAKPVRPARPRWRRALVLAAAAVLAVGGATAALAATGGLLPMVQGAVRFFKPQQPTNLDSMQAAFEACNAAVDASVTDKGVTFTVENVSVDQNFINIFGRLTTETSIRERAEQANWTTPVNEDGTKGEPCPYYTHGLPRQNVTAAAGLFPVVRVNGTVYGADGNLQDACNLYLEDDHTLVYARRILLTEPLPDTFTMDILANRWTDENGEHQTLMGVDGDWTVRAAVDTTATKGAVRTLAPGALDLGGTGKLDLQLFAWTPLGTLLAADDHVRAVPGTGGTEGAFPDYAQEEGWLSLSQVAVRDDQGNWLYPMRPASYTAGAPNKVEYTSPAAGAHSITFVPVSYAGGAGETRLAPAREGARLELGAGYGFTVESITTGPQNLTVRLLPYGPQPAMSLEVFPCGADGTLLDENDRLLLDSYTDHATGAVTLDYYFDIEGEPQGVEQFQYYTWGDLALDEESAATLPLQGGTEQ